MAGPGTSFPPLDLKLQQKAGMRGGKTLQAEEKSLPSLKNQIEERRKLQEEGVGGGFEAGGTSEVERMEEFLDCCSGERGEKSTGE